NRMNTQSMLAGPKVSPSRDEAEEVATLGADWLRHKGRPVRAGATHAEIRAAMDQLHADEAIAIADAEKRRAQELDAARWQMIKTQVNAAGFDTTGMSEE